MAIGRRPGWGKYAAAAAGSLAVGAVNLGVDLAVSAATATARWPWWLRLIPQHPWPATGALVGMSVGCGAIALRLRMRQEADGAGVVVAPVGVPIELCDPLDLEVHPAGDGPERDAAARMPGYVCRVHDEALAAVVAQAAAGWSGMAVLVGSSSTGKTRACWEAVQPLMRAEPGWRLWHPFAPTRAQAVLAGIEAVGRHTVVWLNETQHYLDAGEEVAAALHRLLTDPDRGPVLVLGTLWPEHESRYTAPPTRGGPDPYARARELLAARCTTVPEVFDAAALAVARGLAEGGDQLLGEVLGRGHEGRVAQHLAGAPELLARYHGASPEARALLDAAADARRLGAGLHLPRAFLAGAAPGYLDRDVYDALTDDWLERALAELARPVHGNRAPLHQAREYPDHRPPGTTPALAPAFVPAGPVYRLADYLELHGRRERLLLCPPASFWHAAHAHLTDPDDLRRLADASRSRHRLQWADALYHRAADAGNTEGLARLAEMRMEAGERDSAEALYRLAAKAGNTEAMVNLAWMWAEQAEDWDGAEALYRLAAEAGNTEALLRLAEMRKEAGDWDGAEALYRLAADVGTSWGLAYLAEMREKAGDWDGAEAVCRRAVDAGYAGALVNLAWIRQNAGNRDGAEALYKRAADAGNGWAWTWLAKMQEEAGDRAGAEASYQRAADAGDNEALLRLAEMREHAGG